MPFFHCFSCLKVQPLAGSSDAEKKCPSCGGTNGEVLSADRVKSGMDAGVFYNIDPKTGGRAKKK